MFQKPQSRGHGAEQVEIAFGATSLIGSTTAPFFAWLEADPVQESIYRQPTPAILGTTGPFLAGNTLCEMKGQSK